MFNFKLFNKFIEQMYFKQEGNLALYDSLTGVYNYNWLSLVGNKKFLEKSVFVTVIDLNNFKQLNDTQGHFEGNKLLKQVANQLSLLKNYDSSLVVVRYGGDEFVTVSETDLTIFLERCRKESNLFSYGVVKKASYEPLSVAFVKADEEMYKYKRLYKFLKDAAE